MAQEFSKKKIEDKLKEYLNAEKVIWLKRGIYLDEINEVFKKNIIK